MPKKDLVQRIDLQGNTGAAGGLGGGLPYSPTLNRYLEPWLHIFDARTLQLLSEIFGGRLDGPKVKIRWQTEEPQQGEISAVDIENVPFFSVFVTDSPDAQVGLLIGYSDRPGIWLGWKVGDTNSRPQILVDPDTLSRLLTVAELSSGAAGDGEVPTADGAGGVAWETPAGGPGGGDAADVTYTPAVATDWDGDADPGNVDDALDQLAERTDDLESAGGSGDVVGPASAVDSNFAAFDSTTGKLIKDSGSRLLMQLASSTTADQDAAKIAASWITATHATRAARLSLAACDYGGDREGIRIDTDGAQALIGFFGATAAARQTLATYVADNESAAYTGAADGEAKLADLNALRVAYENLRADYEDLKTKYKASTLAA